MNFGDELRNLREKAGKSRYRVWQLTGLDQGFLGKLEKGEKNPSRNTVILIGLALVHGCNKIYCDDIDELLLLAGFAPLRETRVKKSLPAITARCSVNFVGVTPREKTL